MLFEQVSPFTYSVTRLGAFGLGYGRGDPPAAGLSLVRPGVILRCRPASLCPPQEPCVSSHRSGHSLGSRCFPVAGRFGPCQGRIPATLSCWLPSLRPQGFLRLIKQRACALSTRAAPACVVAQGVVCGHAQKGPSARLPLARGGEGFDLLPALRCLRCLLWAPVSSVTSSQICGSGSGRVLPTCCNLTTGLETSPG